LTSWRSGRLGRVLSAREGSEPGRRVPKTERADGAGAGCGLSGVHADQDRFGSSNSNTAASASVAITRSAGGERERSRSDPGRCFGITILRNHLDSATSPDASASRRASVRPFGVIGGEFDPGSGSTLAACLMHASRARTPSGVLRGGRVRNTWATCPGVGDSRGKPRVIPHTLLLRPGGARKGAIPPEEGPAAD
jgi:hypothetical protein